MKLVYVVMIEDDHTPLRMRRRKHMSNVDMGRNIRMTPTGQAERSRARRILA
jgi:hypothetical protein